MTGSPDLFRVEFQGPDRALGRSPSSVAALPPNFFGNASDPAPLRPKTSRAPSRLNVSVRAALSVTGKNPFNTQDA
jgi:hypothetical protein